MKSSTSGTTVYVYDAFGQMLVEYSNAAAVPSPCKTCYLAYDHLGSVRLVMDETGNVVARHDYLPFGEEVAANTAGRNAQFGVADAVKQRFTGQERDGGTVPNLDYFYARYFNGEQGRFLSADPENAGADPMNPQSWNAYSYAANSPMVLTDPSGMYAVRTHTDMTFFYQNILSFYGSGGSQPPSPALQQVENVATNVRNFLTAPRDLNCVKGAGIAGAAGGAAGGAIAGGIGGGTAGGILGSFVPTAGNIAGALGGGELGALGGASIGGGLGYVGGIAAGYLTCASSSGAGGDSGDNGGGSGGATKNGWTNKQARQKAGALGFQEQKAGPFNSHRQLTFKSSNRWITPDVDGHTGFQTWKLFDSAGNRLGTYSTDLAVRLGK